MEIPDLISRADIARQKDSMKLPKNSHASRLWDIQQRFTGSARR